MSYFKLRKALCPLDQNLLCTSLYWKVREGRELPGIDPQVTKSYTEN